MLDNGDVVCSVYGFEVEDVYKIFDIEENLYVLYVIINFFLIEDISGEFGLCYVSYE